MQTLIFHHTAMRRLAGTRRQAITGVVASGNLEVLLERILPDTSCTIEISTPIIGFGEIWAEVVSDFITRRSPGGLRISINDGGARPDMVALRLAQGARLMEKERA